VSSVVSPNVVLTLQPYVTKSGATFDPSTLGAIFANTGGGNYTLTLVGAPEPTLVGTPIVITSSWAAERALGCHGASVISRAVPV